MKNGNGLGGGSKQKHIQLIKSKHKEQCQPKMKDHVNSNANLAFGLGGTRLVWGDTEWVVTNWVLGTTHDFFLVQASVP